MIVAETTIRVRYAETDQAGYVYYGHYAQYYEVGRVEIMRKLGLSYKLMEERGIFMPVLEMKTKFIKPAFYDDLLTIKTTVKELPITRMRFEYEIRAENGELINIGETTLTFVSKQTYKPGRIPEWFAECLNQ